ncbi:hypothetical protein [Streptomyces sp. CoH17]|uniref:hypothetical protein n=1 Tax=Streptomyces sp. CoH17 TaxID=2992806 RepID=UPI002271A432|nr:hypothetical protein [Streptomyces sp. CoH17]
MTDPARRHLLRLGVLTAAAVPPARATGAATDDRGRPHFPDVWFPVTDHGAVGDGATDRTAAIRAEVRACHAVGRRARPGPARTLGHRPGPVRLLNGQRACPVGASAALRPPRSSCGRRP